MKNIFLIITIACSIFSSINSFSQAGSLDPSFDSDGILIKNFGITEDLVTSSAFQPDGKYIVLGNSSGAGIPKISLVRYTTTGQLDSSFGNNGIVSINYNSNDQRGYDLAIQIDGKILIAGVVNYNFALIRLNADGTIDNTFGANGLATQALVDYQSTAKCLSIQSDNKIVLAGSATNFSNSQFAVTRFNNNGSLDNTFSDSIILTNISAGMDVAEDIKIQSDGNLVVCGVVNDGNNSNYGVVRYDSNGDLDLNFDSNGIAIISLGNWNDYGYAMNIQNDGKIIVTGSTENGSNSDLGVIRLLSNGNLDPSFNSTGIITSDIGGNNNIAKDVSIASNGTIFISGINYNAPYSEGLILAYESNGSILNSFNSGGILNISLGNNGTTCVSIEIDNIGNLMVAGTTTSFSNPNFYSSKYNEFGILDQTFNSTGSNITPISEGQDFGRVVLQQNDEKILIAGHISTPIGNNFAITRLNQDGSTDNQFGSNGDANFDFNNYDCELEDAILQNDGKIILAGFSPSFGNSDFLIMRVNQDGTIDSTFSFDGIQSIDLSGSDDRIHSIAIQSDGKIILVGSAHGGLNPDFGIVRLNTDGSLDTSFDGDGILEIDSYLAGDPNIPYTVSIQPDNKIIISGVAWDGSAYVMALFRINVDGSLDSTFDNDGKSFININGYSPIYSSQIQNDGKIVVCGKVDNDLYVARINQNGSLDNSFATNGLFTMDFFGEKDEANNLSIDSNGKIVITGYAKSGTNKNIFVLRLNNDGSLDSDFDQNGIFLSNFNNLEDIGYSTFIQADGKILIGGKTNNGTTNDFCVMRLISENYVNLESVISNKFILYPNPSFDQIHLKIDKFSKEVTYSIYTISGEVIKSTTEIKSTMEDIDISDLSPGLYIIKVTINGQVTTRDFVKTGC